MKKKNSTAVVLSILTAIFAVVAILCAMAPGFAETIRGTGFQIMFGAEARATNPVPGLIVVFVLEILTVIVALAAAFNKTAARVYLNLACLVMGLANGVLLIFSRELYCLANTFVIDSGATALKLGSGFITSIIFDFLAMLTSLLVVYLAKRKED